MFSLKEKCKFVFSSLVIYIVMDVIELVAITHFDMPIRALATEK